MTTDEAYDTETIASRVMYELLGRRWVWPLLRVTDAYPLQRDIHLSGRPVQTVESVITGQGETVLSWELSNGYRLRLPRDFARLRRYCSDNEVEVTYVYGSRPPAQVQFAIEQLTEQLDLARAGSDACKLPERVTSISRQGLSMTILDPMDYLEKGRTGVPEVDSAIMTFNSSGARMRAGLYTREHPPGRRLMSETVT